MRLSLVHFPTFVVLGEGRGRRREGQGEGMGGEGEVIKTEGGGEGGEGRERGVINTFDVNTLLDYNTQLHCINRHCPQSWGSFHVNITAPRKQQQAHLKGYKCRPPPLVYDLPLHLCIPKAGQRGTLYSFTFGSPSVPLARDPLSITSLHLGRSKHTHWYLYLVTHTSKPYKD